MRIILKMGLETERVRMNPTLPVIVAKGIALEKVCNQHARNVCEEYADNKGDTLINLFSHFILTLPSFPKIGEVTDNNFIMEVVNQ